MDSKGKDQRAFGRVFYTEGKSTLIFYAFDLNDETLQSEMHLSRFGENADQPRVRRTASDCSR